MVREAPKECKTRQKRHEQQVRYRVRSLPTKQREGPDDEELERHHHDEPRGELDGERRRKQRHEFVEETVVRKQVRDILLARKRRRVREASQHGTDGDVLRVVDEGRKGWDEEKQRKKQGRKPVGEGHRLLHGRGA